MKISKSFQENVTLTKFTKWNLNDISQNVSYRHQTDEHFVWVYAYGYK